MERDDMMKKILMVSIVCLLFLSGCVDKKEHNNDDIDGGQVEGLKVSAKEMPNFIIFFKGLVDDYVTNEDVADLKMYDFVTNLEQEDSSVSTESWTGIKLNDLFTKKGIKDFYELEFIGSGYVGGEKVSIRYSKEELTDDVYLVFYHNNELISETQYSSVMLLSISEEESRWAPSLYRIDVL